MLNWGPDPKKLDNLWSIILPEATIDPATLNVYALEDHTISCNISYILSQITGETWTSAKTGTDGYILKDGVYDIETRSQVSTLTISTVKLAELREVAGSNTFTCKTTAAIGPTNWTVEAIQTITIFNPSEDVLDELDNSEYLNQFLYS